MGKRETLLTRRYWRSVGRALIEEFAATPRGLDHGPRLLDGVIVPGGPYKIARKSEVDMRGKDIIVVQTKDARLGMHLMGKLCCLTHNQTGFGEAAGSDTTALRGLMRSKVTRRRSRVVATPGS